jgi:hypothetical protein
LALNSAASSGLNISTLAIRGPHDTNAEFSFWGGETLLTGATVGTGVAGAGFVNTADAF